MYMFYNFCYKDLSEVYTSICREIQLLKALTYIWNILNNNYKSNSKPTQTSDLLMR